MDSCGESFFFYGLIAYSLDKWQVTFSEIFYSGTTDLQAKGTAFCESILPAYEIYQSGLNHGVLTIG